MIKFSLNGKPLKDLMKSQIYFIILYIESHNTILISVQSGLTFTAHNLKLILFLGSADASNIGLTRSLIKIYCAHCQQRGCGSEEK